MQPNKGSYVKVCFNNGLVECGTVSSWNESEIVLETTDSMIVIKNPEDIFIYKIFKDIPEYKPPVSDVFVDKDLTPKEYVRDPALRALDIYQLRKEAQAEEQQRAREKLTEFRPTGHGAPIQYGNIELLRDKSILRNTSEEDK